MILYRLLEDRDGIPEGACITEKKFREVYYTDKALFEPVSEFERQDFIEYEDDDLCKGLGIECILFYTDFELQRFIDKNVDNGITG